VVFVVAMLPAAAALVPAPRVRAADPAPLKIGMPESMFSGLPPAVVQIGAQPFKEMFEKQTGLKGEVAITKDYADATAQLRCDKLDVAVFHGFEYAWVRQHPELVPLLVAVPGNKIQACLVVNVKSKAASPEDLKGACVVVPAATKAHCTLYLDRLREKLPAGCCGLAKTDNKSIEDALDGVATEACEAVLIDVGTLEGYKRNKPGVGDQIKVLDRSPQFPAAVIVYRKDAFNAKTEKSVREGLIKSVTTPQGQMLKGLWKLRGFAEVDKAYQTDLDECLKAYPTPKQK
jgi:ABC-type phosphate/phosphonate transport system substrate-binding protein